MDIFAYSMLCFTSLFTLMDPLGVMPVFLQMTEGMSAGERRSIALKSCALTFVILVLFTLCGRFLFHFFGISTNGFRIAGGIIIFKIGYDMLQAHFTHVKLNETEKKEYSRNITVTPLAVTKDPERADYCGIMVRQPVSFNVLLSGKGRFFRHGPLDAQAIGGRDRTRMCHRRIYGQT